MRVVIFELSGCRIAIDLADAQEFSRLPAILPLPKAPAIIEGIVNFRGRVVPVLNVRRRFRLPAKAPHPMDYLVLARVDSRLVALRVDHVLGIEALDPQDVEDAEAVAPGSEYVAGVAKLPDGLVLIHDLRTFLADAESRALDEAMAASADTAG